MFGDRRAAGGGSCHQPCPGLCRNANRGLRRCRHNRQRNDPDHHAGCRHPADNHQLGTDRFGLFGQSDQLSRGRPDGQFQRAGCYVQHLFGAQPHSAHRHHARHRPERCDQQHCQRARLVLQPERFPDWFDRHVQSGRAGADRVRSGADNRSPDRRSQLCDIDVRHRYVQCNRGQRQPERDHHPVGRADQCDRRVRQFDLHGRHCPADQQCRHDQRRRVHRAGCGGKCLVFGHAVGAVQYQRYPHAFGSRPGHARRNLRRRKHVHQHRQRGWHGFSGQRRGASAPRLYGGDTQEQRHFDGDFVRRIGGFCRGRRSGDGWQRSRAVGGRKYRRHRHRQPHQWHRCGARLRQPDHWCRRIQFESLCRLHRVRHGHRPDQQHFVPVRSDAGCSASLGQRRDRHDRHCRRPVADRRQHRAACARRGCAEFGQCRGRQRCHAQCRQQCRYTGSLWQPDAQRERCPGRARRPGADRGYGRYAGCQLHHRAQRKRVVGQRARDEFRWRDHQWRYCKSDRQRGRHDHCGASTDAQCQCRCHRRGFKFFGGWRFHIGHRRGHRVENHDTGLNYRNGQCHGRRGRRQCLWRDGRLLCQ